MWPTWSPDGRRIAFAGLRDGRWQVYVTDADGGKLRQVTDGPQGASLPKFGPDGRLAYVVWRQPLGKRRQGDLVVDGKEPRTVVRDAVVVEYAWRPDGKMIGCSTPGVVVFLDLATGTARTVELSDIDKQLASFAALHLCWSPDGRAVACRCLFYGGRQQGGPKMFGDDELFVIPHDGKATWFRPGVEADRIEWVKQKDTVHRP
jgi:Tol biopolymer transport system component